ncbi:serine/threonine protein kinase [Engelhardtia mirabilis]|uniref:non-specific serine/threonine protein kinase n=1 Tax=Engelhardtia mirabilis TaxID=2528011 RepID=A0A518BFS0_9BACT|nr:Serine/threonine-protein kinase PrkC [Planctomycetes bacterium Pla133]QDV00089.1 Serine/threonine-protein kinase PrkC [Planctomycetes bacterium Pla86]
MIRLEAGETIGTYKVREFVARGAFACVYIAEDPRGAKVALKVGDVAGGGRYVTRCLEVTSHRSPEWISPDETPGEAIFFRNDGVRIDFLDLHEIDELIRSEGNLLEAAKSQNLVRVRDSFEHEGRPVLALDFVRGKTLREKVRALEGIRLNWFLSIVRALQRLGKAGTMEYHGDLKPENIIVKPSGSVVMIDPAMRDGSRGLISTTPHYNPLLLQSPKADVMGIGVMLYEILTGTLPFDEVPWQYAGREQGGEVERLSLSYFLSYPPPRELNPNTPEALEQIVYRSLTVMEYGLPELEKDLVAFLRKQ